MLKKMQPYHAGLSTWHCPDHFRSSSWSCRSAITRYKPQLGSLFSTVQQCFVRFPTEQRRPGARVIPEAIEFNQHACAGREINVDVRDKSAKRCLAKKTLFGK